MENITQKVEYKFSFKDFVKMNLKNIIIVAAVILLLLFTYLFGFGVKLTNGKEVEVILNKDTDATYIDPGYKATLYGFIPLPVNIRVDGYVNMGRVDTYNLTYSYHFIKNVQAVRTVKVVEKEAPVITLKGKNPSFACSKDNYKEEGYFAVDNYDGDLTKNVNKDVQDGKIVYSVTDSSGNVGKVERNLTYSDTEKPVITLNGSSSITIFVGDSYTDPGYKATDNCLGDITNSVTVTGSVDTKNTGTYVIAYNVTDGTNKSENTRTVNVIKKPEGAQSSTTPLTIGKIYNRFVNGTYTCTGIDPEYGATKQTVAFTITNSSVAKTLVTLIYANHGTAQSYYDNYFSKSDVTSQFNNVVVNNSQISYEPVDNVYKDYDYENLVNALTNELGEYKWQCK